VLNRTRAVALVLGLIVISSGVLFAYRMGVRDGVSEAVTGDAPLPLAHISDALNAELDRIREVEKIEDPYERCMAYPNPPEFDWSPKVIEAACRKLSRRMLSAKEIEDALDQHHPERLDHAFDGYLAKNFAAQAPEHGFLTWTYWWMFESSSKWAADITERWVRADPQSAYALAARGIHYARAAYDARGTRYASATPDANFTRMRELVGMARRDLEESLERNPRLIAAYHGLLYISRLRDLDGGQRDIWVKRALALDPYDQWIYLDWMGGVEPKWGGSYAQMEHVASEAAQHADANPLLGFLKAEPLCDRANLYRCDSCEKDGQKSIDLFREAAAFGPSGCFLDGAGAAAVLAQDLQTATRYYSQAYRFFGTDEWLAYRAQNLRSLGRGAWALENLNTALTRNPGNTTLLYALALAYADAGRVGDVEKTYLAILEIEPDNPTAAFELSRLYVGELKEPDKAQSLVDHMLAQDSTSAPAWFAKTMLCEALDDKPGYRAAAAKFLRYVNYDDPWQTANISLVQAKLRHIGPATQE